MRCNGCGQSLTEGVSVCLHCGTPVPPGYPAKRAEVALLPEPVPPSGDNWTSFSAPPTSPYQKSDEYMVPSAPPPPPIYAPGPGATNYAAGMTDNLPYQHTSPMPRTITHLRRLITIVVVCAVALLSLGVFAYVHAMGRNGSTTGGDLNNQPGGGSALCTVPSIDQNAARNLMHPQLTSGLRDPAHKDFAPIDTANTFHVGQTVYFTFTIATNVSATLTAEWCWGQAGNTSDYPLSVSHNLGSQGYFNLRNLDKAAVGTGVLVVRWNDAIAYTSEFFVKP